MADFRHGSFTRSPTDGSTVPPLDTAALKLRPLGWQRLGLHAGRLGCRSDESRDSTANYLVEWRRGVLTKPASDSRESGRRLQAAGVITTPANTRPPPARRTASLGLRGGAVDVGSVYTLQSAAACREGVVTIWPYIAATIQQSCTLWSSRTTPETTRCFRGGPVGFSVGATHHVIQCSDGTDMHAQVPDGHLRTIVS